jgi:PAS domain S-box-containing protein
VEQATALKKNEEQMRLLIDGIRDYAIMHLSLTGDVTSWNAGAQRLLGYTSEEIIGRHFSAFYRPEDLALQKPAIEIDTALSKGRFEEEGIRITKTGRAFVANVVLTPILDPTGAAMGFAKITRGQQAAAARCMQSGMERNEQHNGSTSSDLIHALRGRV